MPDVRFESFGLAARLLSPPKPMGRIHHHREVEINFLFRGSVTYLHRGSMRSLERRGCQSFGIRRRMERSGNRGCASFLLAILRNFPSGWHAPFPKP